MKNMCGHLVIGAGLSGLFLAALLKRSGQSVTLVDGRRGVGGYRVGVGGQWQGWPIFPYSESLQSFLGEFRSGFFPAMKWEVSEVETCLLKGKEWKPFRGFSDRNFKEKDLQSIVGRQVLEELTLSHSLYFRSGLQDWVDILYREVSDSFHPQTIVTNLKVDSGKVREVEINGSLVHPVESVYLCASPLELMDLLPSRELAPLATLLKKKAYVLSSLHCELHSEKSWPEDVPRLFFSGEPTANFWLSTVFESNRGNVLSSMSLLPYELEQNNEALAMRVGKFRKGLEKILTPWDQKNITSKIYLQAGSAGYLRPLVKGSRWQGVDNLFVFSNSLCKDFHPLGGLIAIWDWAVENALSSFSTDIIKQ